MKCRLASCPDDAVVVVTCAGKHRPLCDRHTLEALRNGGVATDLDPESLDFPTHPEGLPMPTCQFPGCTNTKIKARDLCDRDYQRTCQLGLLVKAPQPLDYAAIGRAWDAQAGMAKAPATSADAEAVQPPSDTFRRRMCKALGMGIDSSDDQVVDGAKSLTGVQADLRIVRRDRDVALAEVVKLRADLAEVNARPVVERGGASTYLLNQLVGALGLPEGSTEAQIAAAVSATTAEIEEQRRLTVDAENKLHAIDDALGPHEGSRLDRIGNLVQNTLDAQRAYVHGGALELELAAVKAELAELHRSAARDHGEIANLRDASDSHHREFDAIDDAIGFHSGSTRHAGDVLGRIRGIQEAAELTSNRLHTQIELLTHERDEAHAVLAEMKATADAGPQRKARPFAQSPAGRAVKVLLPQFSTEDHETFDAMHAAVEILLGIE